MHQIVITDSKVIGHAKHEKDIRAILSCFSLFLTSIDLFIRQIRKNYATHYVCLIKDKNYRK